MWSRNPPLRPEDLFLDALPLAGRAAEVRSARVIIRQAMLDREDVKQEAIIGVWVALSRFDPSRASLRTFVERVVAAKIASLVRRSLAKKRTKHHAAAESFQWLVGVELHLDLQRLLAQLGPRERRVAELLGECSPTQIARRLRISRPCVYRRINRIRAAIRKGGLGR
jgi:RNA polymerase sigma factor (sigma-70 family)